MTIKNGSKVTVHYTLTVDGQVVDTSEGKTPLTYTHGNKEIIPGLEEHIVGMIVGDKSTAVIEPAQGYGEKNPEAVQTIPRKTFKDADKLQLGAAVSGMAGDQQFQAIIVGLTDDDVTLDMNHPLAGKTLNFEIQLVKVD